MPACHGPDCRQPISSKASVCIFCGAEAGVYAARSLKLTAVASVVAGLVSLVGLYGLVGAAGLAAPPPALADRPSIGQEFFALAGMEKMPLEAADAASRRDQRRDQWIVIAPTPAAHETPDAREPR